ncbi:MAG: response regulator transcription factor [Ottowia sp.]|nr:response regulator transcription factor [Ottowia sp.]
MKILIADDHRLVVEAVADKLKELAPDVAVVTAGNVAELLSLLSDELDLAMLDLGMPGAQGLGHVREVLRRQPQLPVVVLSGDESPATMRAAIEAGARGFIPKAYSPDVMLSAVQLVLRGGTYVPPMMMAEVPIPATGARNAGPDPLTGQWAHALTERQRDVLNLLSQGQPNKVIGRTLGISEGTVKIHLAAIFRVLKVRNRTEAVVAARELTGS